MIVVKSAGSARPMLSCYISCCLIELAIAKCVTRTAHRRVDATSAFEALLCFPHTLLMSTS